ncbi:MAG: hypothetical protein AB1627_11405 [Chloroflexota bacterium]
MIRARPLVLALALAVGSGAAPAGPVAASGAPAAAAAATAGATRAFRMNLAGPRDFVPQSNDVQCVGASIQMMLNIVHPGRDASRRTQRRLQDLARAWSGPRPPGFGERQGASIRGWAASLVIHRAGPYRIVGADSLEEAMRIAARAIREWERPVGLLVWRGRHAWVMSGFEATADPLRSSSFRVTRAHILDPLYPNVSEGWGPAPRPGVAIPVAAVGRQFVRRRSSGPWNRLPFSVDLSGKYVLVVPTGYVRPGLD